MTTLPQTTIESTPSAPAAPRQPSRLRSILGPVLGNVLEWYDFAVYAYVAALIAKNFFPSTDGVTASLAAFATFGVGFLARPVGSIVIGRLADTRGRKAALLLTVYLMAGGTLLIAILPTYANAGLLAPLLLIVARLMQGFSAGGEWGGAVSFIVEWAPERRRGFFGSFHLVGLVCGLLMGSGVAALLHSMLTAQEMLEWGWRLPFVIGCLIGPFALWMRRNVDETPAYLHAVDKVEKPLPMLQDGPGFRLALRVFGMSILSTIGFYVLLFYMPTWVMTYLKLQPSQALWANAVGLALLAVLTPLFGAMSDTVGRKPILIGACVVAAVVAYPAFSYLLAQSAPTVMDVILVQCVFSVVLAAISGALPTALVEMFATRNRTTWMSVGYGACVTVFGGFSPFIAVWLINQFATPIAPVYYLIAGAVVSGIVTLSLRETAFEPLR